MDNKAVALVLFHDLLEDNSSNHYGILFDNGFVLCLCCGGYVGPEDYEIVEQFDGFAYLDETLRQYY